MPKLLRENISSMRRDACGMRRLPTTRSDTSIWLGKAPWPETAASRRSAAMMMQKRKRVLFFGGCGVVLVLVGVFALTSYGQFGRSQYTSPPANVAATIAGKKITVEYYAPSMHGRKVMGGLVPFGEVWCTGANWATKITAEGNLQMGGLKLPAGSYSIWTLPNAN